MIFENIQQIIQNLPNKNLYNEAITVLAVTKKQPISAIQQALLAGFTNIAESTVQEFLAKERFFAEYLPQTRDNVATEPAKLQRHFIGKLQRNKVKYLVHKIDLLHSLDSLSLAEEIEKQGEKHNWTCRCLLQVNIAKEESKGGFFVEELEKAYMQLRQLQQIELCGLMTILPKNESAAQLKQYAQQMRTLYDAFRQENTAFCHLSMGMSQDYKICLEAGSNMLRLGTAIFGNRA